MALVCLGFRLSAVSALAVMAAALNKSARDLLLVASPAAVVDGSASLRCGPGVAVVAASTVTPGDLLFLRLRPRRDGAFSSAVGRSGGPVQELHHRCSSSSGMMASVDLRASCVPGWGGGSVVGGSALLRLLRRLKMVVPGSSEHGFSPADATRFRFLRSSTNH